jgi:hypothetical protein
VLSTRAHPKVVRAVGIAARRRKVKVSAYVLLAVEGLLESDRHRRVRRNGTHSSPERGKSGLEALEGATAIAPSPDSAS